MRRETQMCHGPQTENHRRYTECICPLDLRSFRVMGCKIAPRHWKESEDFKVQFNWPVNRPGKVIVRSQVSTIWRPELKIIDEPSRKKKQTLPSSTPGRISKNEVGIWCRCGRKWQPPVADYGHLELNLSQWPNKKAIITRERNMAWALFTNVLPLALHPLAFVEERNWNTSKHLHTTRPKCSAFCMFWSNQIGSVSFAFRGALHLQPLALSEGVSSEMWLCSGWPNGKSNAWDLLSAELLLAQHCIGKLFWEEPCTMLSPNQINPTKHEKLLLQSKCFKVNTWILLAFLFINDWTEKPHLAFYFSHLVTSHIFDGRGTNNKFERPAMHFRIFPSSVKSPHVCSPTELLHSPGCGRIKWKLCVRWPTGKVQTSIGDKKLSMGFLVLTGIIMRYSNMKYSTWRSTSLT